MTNWQTTDRMFDYFPVYLNQIPLGYDTTTGQLVDSHPPISQHLSDVLDDYIWSPVHRSFDPEVLQKRWDDPDE